MDFEKEVNEWDGKHPLEDCWTLWYSDRSLPCKWEDCLRKVGSFDTAEEFWCYFNYLKPLSELKTNTDISVFKNGVLPMWEDQVNKEGGRWAINFDRAFPKSRLDEFWMDLVMTIIGNNFKDSGDLITGTVVNRRDRSTRISVWTTISNRSRKLELLGHQIREAITLPRELIICFQAHKDCAKNPMAVQALYRV